MQWANTSHGLYLHSFSSGSVSGWIMVWRIRCKFFVYFWWALLCMRRKREKSCMGLVFSKVRERRILSKKYLTKYQRFPVVVAVNIESFLLLFLMRNHLVLFNTIISYYKKLFNIFWHKSFPFTLNFSCQDLFLRRRDGKKTPIKVKTKLCIQEIYFNRFVSSHLIVFKCTSFLLHYIVHH